MNKELILNKLNSANLDKDKIIVISGASLVVQGIIDKTQDIDLSCDKEYYDSLNWKKKIGTYGIEIKYNDVFEISNNLYYPKDIIYINGYKFMNIDKCLEIKKQLNRNKDKKVIEIIQKNLNK